jgi:predicted DsbA family dithiol-disulfide isomerase
LFQQGKPITPDVVTSAATASKLEVKLFDECLSSGRHRQNVARNLREAMTNRLEGEPVISVNGIRVTGAQRFEAIDDLIQNEIGML